MSEQLEAIKELSGLVLQENWEQVKTFLTDDLMYKVGSGEPKHGKEAVSDFLAATFKNTAKLESHDVPEGLGRTRHDCHRDGRELSARQERENGGGGLL